MHSIKHGVIKTLYVISHKQFGAVQLLNTPMPLAYVVGITQQDLKIPVILKFHGKIVEAC